MSFKHFLQWINSFLVDSEGEREVSVKADTSVEVRHLSLCILSGLIDREQSRNFLWIFTVVSIYKIAFISIFVIRRTSKDQLYYPTLEKVDNQMQNTKGDLYR